LALLLKEKRKKKAYLSRPDPHVTLAELTLYAAKRISHEVTIIDFLIFDISQNVKSSNTPDQPFHTVTRVSNVYSSIIYESMITLQN
jgi:hypothetical protein